MSYFFGYNLKIVTLKFFLNPVTICLFIIYSYNLFLAIVIIRKNPATFAVGFNTKKQVLFKY